MWAKEQLEPRKTGGGLERKERQRKKKQNSAYTLIKGGKGEGEWKGSRICVKTIAICTFLSQGLPCGAVHATCRLADVEFAGWGKSRRQKKQPTEDSDD